MPNSAIFAAIIATAIGMTACGTSMQVSELDPSTGRFPTGTKVSMGDILINEKVDLRQYKSFLYVKDNNWSDTAREFVKESLVRMAYFEEILLGDEFGQYLIQKGLGDKVTNVSDLIGLHQAQKHLGQFLVFDMSAEWKVGDNYEGNLKVLDPKDGRTLFHVQSKAFNWSGLDQPLYYPLFNAFADWAEENGGKKQIRVAAATASSSSPVAPAAPHGPSVAILPFFNSRADNYDVRFAATAANAIKRSGIATVTYSYHEPNADHSLVGDPSDLWGGDFVTKEPNKSRVVRILKGMNADVGVMVWYKKRVSGWYGADYQAKVWVINGETGQVYRRTGNETDFNDALIAVLRDAKLAR